MLNPESIASFADHDTTTSPDEVVVSLPQTPLMSPKPHDSESEDEALSPAPQTPLGRLAFVLAPLYSAFYDFQMRSGAGVRAIRQRIVLPDYSSTCPPLRAGFLSDLHLGPTSGRVASRQAWQILREAKPDVLLLGGDFLYADQRGLPTLLRELQRWTRHRPPGGIWACLGNHDYRAGAQTMTTCLEACGVRVLVNQSEPLPEPWGHLWIAGIDDTLHGAPDLDATLRDVPRQSPVILLSHSPDVCEFAAMNRVGLTLCGHTHGGQICWPDGRAPHLDSHWGRIYPHGLHRHAGRWLMVSRGVGTVGFPLRLWSPPDVLLLEIVGRGGWR